MTNQPQGLEGCSRCPICHNAPSESIYKSQVTGDLLIELICEEHRFLIAMGRTLEDAARHFNIAVRFYEAGGFKKVA